MANPKKSFKAAYSMARKERAELEYLSSDLSGVDLDAYEYHLVEMIYGRRPEQIPEIEDSRATRAAARVAFYRYHITRTPETLQQRLAGYKGWRTGQWDDDEAYDYT